MLTLRRIGFSALLGLAVLPVSPGAGEPPREKSKWMRNLPAGVTVELIGICDPDATPPVWWTPDGRSLAQPVCKVVSLGGVSRSGQRQRAFAVQVIGPDINPTFDWLFDPNSGGSSGSAVDDKSEPLKGMCWAMAEFPSDRGKTSLKLNIAATPWITQAIYPRQAPPEARIDERCVTFSQPRATEKGTAVVVVDNFLDVDTRVRAFDRAGQNVGSRGNIDKQKAFRVHDIEFDEKSDEIKRYEFQARPLEKVVFENVPLDAPRR
jgi:hypothetical protein